MALLPIIIAPDPRLKIKTRAVGAVDTEVRQLMNDMLETMYDANGIGLAAPQVGDQRSVIVIDVTGKEEEPSPVCMANPEIVWVSDEDSLHEEGCLSLPEHYADVVRPDVARVRYLDETAAECMLEVDGMLATCVQHEIDHLEGILFVDHLTSLKRNIILRKLVKTKRQAAAKSA